ncbi:MAG TPA: hypothetical protein VFO26_02355 [Gaiella sp.]|uniref:hypothetical protein n=1 Tax=Gaiella sp. TaxID=2663207 RepID=UPI002D80B5C0|nr:hypothetical protein [Gaiella sp.]HET9286377.1 hypothetical protein [Gaiella sp.]
MRRLAVLVALLAPAIALLALPRAEARTAARASLELVSVDPVRVRGERFRPAERARVTARVEGRIAVAHARAGRRGGFIVAFPAGLTAGGCVASVRLVAVGNRGSRATLALDHVACAPTS